MAVLAFHTQALKFLCYRVDDQLITPYGLEVPDEVVTLEAPP
jgi:hypothetical protein